MSRDIILVDTRDNIRVVTSNNFLKAAGLENISLKACKLLYLAIAQCKKDDKEFYTYTIKASDFAEFMGIASSHVYEEADNITDELMKGFIKYKPPGEKVFHKYQLFEKCDYTNKAELTFNMSKDMTELILDLKRDFSQPLLSDFSKMKSTFSIKIWHLMQREMHSKKPYASKIFQFDLSLEELREVTGTQNSFERISQFKEKVLDKAIREIKENCEVIITYTDIKKGRSIIGFKFSAVSNYYIPEAEVPQKIKDKVRKFELSTKMKNEELDLHEQAEYDELTLKAEQLSLFS